MLRFPSPSFIAPARTFTADRSGGQISGSGATSDESKLRWLRPAQNGETSGPATRRIPRPSPNGKHVLIGEFSYCDRRLSPRSARVSDPPERPTEGLRIPRAPMSAASPMDGVRVKRITSVATLRRGKKIFAIN